jgi:hypothetical protein
VNNLSPTAADDDAVRCLFAIEMSSWIVAVHTPVSDTISRSSLQSYDGKGLLKLMARIRRCVAKEFNRAMSLYVSLQPALSPRQSAALPRSR